MDRFELLLYLPYRNNSVAHLIRQFPDTGEIYIYCNRFLGQATGDIIPIDKFDSPEAQNRPVCDKCKLSIEMSLERVGVMMGFRPDSVQQFIEVINKDHKAT